MAILETLPDEDAHKEEYSHTLCYFVINGLQEHLDVDVTQCTLNLIESWCADNSIDIDVNPNLQEFLEKLLQIL